MSVPKIAQRNELALALVSGRPLEIAASEAGMSKRTAYRLPKEPQFVELVDHLSRVHLEHQVAALASARGQPGETLDRQREEMRKKHPEYFT
jgi:hypothetical protein